MKRGGLPDAARISGENCWAISQLPIRTTHHHFGISLLLLAALRTRTHSVLHCTQFQFLREIAHQNH